MVLEVWSLNQTERGNYMVAAIASLSLPLVRYFALRIGYEFEVDLTDFHIQPDLPSGKSSGTPWR